MPLKPGDRIERYVIEAPLGAGGMGEVYRAYDSRLKRSIGLKILHIDAPADPNAKTSAPVSEPGSRMLREAQLAASLDHPNVVAVFDVGQIENPPELRGTTYLAMELIRGQSLRKYVGDASVKMKTRVRWLEDIARALGAAHAAGLVHRDVKPENVMIREDGIVKVLDFGIAKRTAPPVVDPTSSTEGFAVPTMTKEGAVVGTPFYMAPEQLKAEKLDGRADQFAWGVVAYELLTGKSLWSSEGGGYSLVAQILQAPPPPIDALAGAPDGVARAVVRALAKDREARFPTMGALLEELTGKPEGADTDTRIPLGAPPPRRSAPSLPGDTDGFRTAPTVTIEGPVAPPAPTAKSAPAPPAPARKRWPLWAAGAVGVLALAITGAFSLRPHAAPPVRTTETSAPPGVECTTNERCSEKHPGEPWVCKAADHTCAAVQSEDCSAYFEPDDLLGNGPIWIGALFPTKGADAADGLMHVHGMMLARKELAEAIRAYDGASSSRKLRRLGLVACDDGVDPARAARHLVEVGAPAIAGFESGNELVGLAGSLLIPSGVLSMSTISADPRILHLPPGAGGSRLVWRTTYGDDAIAHAAARIVHEAIEPRLASGLQRVALVREDASGGLAFAEVFLRDLVFNGRSAAANGNGYLELVATRTPSPADVLDLARKLVELQPSVVVFAADTPSVSVPVVNAVEASWPAHAPRPTYLITNDSTNAFSGFLGSSVERRRRLFGLVSPSDTPDNARFVLKYNAAYKDQVTREVNSSFSYDAFYVLAYAVFAQGSGPVTGATLAEGMTRLVPPGLTVHAGPTDIVAALTTLSSGGQIDFEGASGKLDFDRARGDAPSDFVISCADVDARGRAHGSIETSLLYDAKTDTVKGKMECR